MPVRKDALVAAAQLIQAVQSIALAHAPYAVGTWANCQFLPIHATPSPGKSF